jgi:hypothetical protein
VEEARIGKGWRRVVALSCTLLLVGSLFLVLGMTVWAQEQPQPEEQPAETGDQPVGATQQPVQTGQATEGRGLTIEYWEPQLGTRTVYYINDYLNDIHGNIFGTSTLGYWDAAYLYSTSISPVNYASSYYRSVEAISQMVRVYFDLGGPWYFNMTTPYKYIEEVIGIHEAPDAAHFPQATYAVRYLVIGSGGARIWGTSYRSNDATEMAWKTWGSTIEYFPTGEQYSRKEIVRLRSPHDKKTPVSQTIASFPMSLGQTGSVDAVYAEGDWGNQVSGSATYEVVAEGKLTLPAGTYDALLVEYRWTSPLNGKQFTQFEYVWFVPGIGAAVDVQSLPNILGPAFEDAVDAAVLEVQTVP